MSWIGVKGRSKDEVLASLGLADTGREVEPYSALFSCTELPSGWFISCSGEFDYATAEKVGELSARGFAVACQLEEHVMYSGARAFNNGAALWSVVHDPDVDRHEVTVEGRAACGIRSDPRAPDPGARRGRRGRLHVRRSD
jgi:hypothetical protein